VRRIHGRFKISQGFSKVVESLTAGAEVYEFSLFTVDPLKRLLLRGSTPIPLPPKVFDTLLYMVENPDRVLGKDEMMAAIWPGRVLEESNLSQNVFTLRKTLSEGGEDRCIVTAPGRGYRFTAPVRRVSRNSTAPSPGSGTTTPTTVGVPSSDAGAPGSSPLAAPLTERSGRAIRNVGLILGLAVVISVAWYGLEQRRGISPVKERSRILLTGIANLTNDSAFDTVPERVLEIGLSQSPFLILIPPQQVGKTLQLMERPADAKLSADLAQEVCLRNQGKAVMSGAIAVFGSRYVVMLEASDCTSGEHIVQSKIEAARKEDVPRALDSLMVKMRTDLGESLASVRQFDVRIEQATTGSFEALKAYSVGEQARLNGDNESAVPLFKRAVELDPSFALAYAELAATYVGLRQPELARRYYQQAFQYKDRASEKEKLWISAEYFKLVGKLSESIDSYRAMARLYPNDGRPWESLADLYTRMARYQDAVDAAKEGLRRNPDESRAYVILARAYKRSNRFNEAYAVGRQSVAKGLDGWNMHCLLYEVAFALGDVDQMSAQAATEAGKPNERWMLEYEALGAATAGRLKQSRELFARVFAATQASGGEDQSPTLSGFYTDYIEVLSLFGLAPEARELVAKVPDLEQNEDGPYVLAAIGDFERAADLDAEFGKRYPDSTLTNTLTRPIAQAMIALGQHRPRDAIAVLQPSLPAKLRTFHVPSLLGQAYLELKSPAQAAAEFTDIIDNRGVDAVSPMYPLAYLGLARALQLQGDLRKSRKAYEQLFAFWKDADADNPVLVRARAEYAALGQ
jgi:DNA-binding winged helix-turn-helix (wHTH) protein/tetratricopeptide (TPR) repeat protein